MAIGSRAVRVLVHRVLLFILTAGFCPRPCAAIDRITTTQSIKDPEFIVSDGYGFKMGFFSLENSSNRYVGIMYNVSVTTVVWVANRDKPLSDSSGVVTISEDGNIVVLDGQQKTVWSSNVSGLASNCSAQLLDTGNLVLIDNSDGRILWESFRHPSDSFLKTMRLSTSLRTNERNIMTSWRNPFDPSPGNFSAGVVPLGMLQFYIWNNGVPYWRTGPWNGQVFIGVPDMVYRYLNGFYLVDDNSGTQYLTFSYLNASVRTYYFLNTTGYFVQRYWSDRLKDWQVVWVSLKSECDVYGKCGSFGICNPQGSPICTCLQGFEPKHADEWSKGNWSSGCIRKALLQCERNTSASEDGKQDGFLKLEAVKVPDFSEWSLDPEDNCRRQCLSNCSCKAYGYYTGIGCTHWSRNLIDIQQFASGGADLYIRVAHSELGRKKDNRDMKVVIASVLAVVSIGIAIFAYLYWKKLAKHKGRKRGNESSSFETADMYSLYLKEHTDGVDYVKLEDLSLFNFELLVNATENFHSANRLGEGGFGTVYKGKLTDGQEIAVKRLSRSSDQGLQEFMNEVLVISKLQHRNLVKLLGCCVKGEEKLLVYEYLPKKSLDAYLFDSGEKKTLDWCTRANIIEGIGRGLLYLHRDSRLKIIHRDLKASNILLDDKLNPKISDFGMARIFGGQQDQAKTHRVVGTYGYMAPEYAMQGTFSEKSDVYSFGVLLLEIVSGRRNTSFYNDEHSLSLLGHAWKLWNEDGRVKFIDPLIFDSHFESEMLRYIHVGLLCVQEFETDRPNVSTVLSMLSSEIAELPYPKLPAFTVRQSTPDVPSSQQSQSEHSVNNVTITIVEGR